MKRMKMINKSQYYYTIKGFSCLGKCVIMSPLPNFSFSLIMFLFLGLLETVDPFFLCTKNPPAMGGRCLLFLFFLFPSLHVVVNKPLDVV